MNDEEHIQEWLFTNSWLIKVDGIASLENQLQMSRLIDRIEYIYCRFSHKQIDQNDRWHDGIHEAINL